MSTSDISLIKVTGGVVASVLTFLFGAPDVWLWALISFVIIDYISGVVAGYITKTLSSRTGVKGIFKKLLYFAVVAVANIIDTAANLGGTLRNVAVGFLVANEGLSILENCGRCGLPVPKKLLHALEQLKKDNEQ